MFGITGALLYFVILFFKIIEVSLFTVRIILISKGQKLFGALVGIIEITIWLTLASKVLTGMQEDPMMMVVYALGFTFGIYVGGIVDEKLAIGNIKVNAIVLEEDGINLAKKIRKHGFAVTKYKGHGMNHPRYQLSMIIKRKRLKELLNLLRKYEENIVIDYHDTQPACGVYGVFKK